ncbi:MAG: SBBP repeat-containing protein, partial [candidate division WOR-3 bacterium]|nr:SBBP repeat-containing protein [candidate division WOR-3 bacterium]
MPYNKNNTLILVLLLIGLIGLLTLANGQASQAWARRWTSAGSNADYAYVMTTDNTGNVYVAGSMQTSSSNSRAQVIKYNTNGDTLWRWTDPYTGTFNERASSIVVGPSGNVYIAGYTMRVGSGDYLIVKLNGQTGDTIWFRTYDLPGATTGYDFARRIAIDADENVYVTGYGSRPGTGTSDIGTIKYNTAGVFQWEAFYDGGVAGADQGYSIYVNETGVYVTGYSNPSASGTAYDMVTIKYNPTNGNEVWSRRYNGTGNGADYGRDVVADASGNVYVTGSATNANTDFTTIKYNSSGDTFWLRTYNGPDNLGDAGWWIKLDGSGNVYVYGNSTYSATDRGQDLCVVKYDNNGNQQMVATYNGPNVYEICPDETGQNPIALDANGNIYIAGTSRRAAPSTLNDIIAVKFNSSGTFQWEARYDYNDNSETAKSIGLDNSNNVYVSGHGNGLGTNIDWVTVKYTQGVTGTDYTSQASGNWSNPNTWTPPGGPPTIYDNVTIATGHTVTVDGSAGCKNLTIQTGATFDNSGNYAFAINGDLINDGTFTAGTGVYTFGGSADSISGTNPVVIPNLSMVGSYTNNTTLTVSTTLSGAGSLIQGTNATLNIGAPTVGPSLNASATGNTVRYNSTTQDQTIKGITYHNLVIDKGSYTATLDANATVARNLIIASGILNDNAKVLTVNGDITNNGSHIGSGNGRIRLAGGSGEHILSGAGSYNNLVMNDVNGASLTASFTVNGVLYCSTGVITTNANVITLSNTAVGAISGGSSSSYINGPLARILPADLATGTTYRFPIGKSAYQLFELVNPTTGSSGPIIITAEVFDANCGGTPGTG